MLLCMSDLSLPALISSIDLTAVENSDGVVAVLSAADVPGINDCSPLAGDDPVFAEDKVLYYGQSLFAVVAKDMASARSAARLAKIQYVPKPAILTINFLGSERIGLVGKT